MPERLPFADAGSASDALTFARRAATLSETGVRFQASGGTVAMTAAPLAPKGLFDNTPTVLVVRAAKVDPELVCDIVVDGSALALSADDDRALDLPETGLSPSWAGVAPPRSGWHETGALDAAELAAKAQWGVSAVARAIPRDAGEDAVRLARAGVWSVPEPALGGLPLGAAFAALVMGLIVGEEAAPVLTSGAWTRISLRRGHVLVRGPVRVGMTDVRSVG